MSCYARALVSLLLAGFAWVASGCTLGPGGDYQVAVSWLINGATPNADLCAEQRIASFRLEVRTGSGRVLKTLESDCASTIKLEDGESYGGFLTSAAFDWETDYHASLTPLDATGQPVSKAGESDFWLDFDEADIYELGTLDYLQPVGSAASLTADWRVDNSADPLDVSCARRDIKTVRILASSALDDELGDAVQVGEAPCRDGKYASDGKVLARGFYNIFLVAVTSTGSVAAESKPPSRALVDGTKDVTLETRAVFFPN